MSLSSSGYMPHGQCYLWQTPLVGLHVVSDALIAIAYFSIPIMLIYFVKRRKDMPFSGIFALFGAFIILCGVGHLLEIWTLWHPAYWVSGVEKALTAIVSCYTALQLGTLLPQFLALKTPEQLETVNRELENQIAERQRTEEILQTIVAGTSSVTGNDFFPALAQNLAIALDVAYVLVCETVDSSLQQLRTLALWSGGQLIDNIEYNLSNTPCKIALESKSLCAYTDQVQQHFPDAGLLKELGAESYVGVPLLDANQQPIGQLCILDVKPLLLDERTRALFSVFAARAATELQRKWAEDALRNTLNELEQRVQERTAELQDTNLTLEQEVQERLAMEQVLQDTVQREKAARTLAEASEKQFRFLTEAIPQHVWTALPEGQLDYANQRVINYFGRSSDQILSLNWQKLVHPDDLPTCFERWQQATATNTQFETEFRLLRGVDQSYRWHIARALPIYDDAGHLISWFGTSTDINDQKQAEITLQKVAEREQAIARIIRQMRQTLDLEMIFANTTAELQQVIQCDRVLIYRFNPDWSGELVYESVTSGWQLLIPPTPEQSKLIQVSVEQADCVIKTLDGDELTIQDTYLQETQGGNYTRGGSYRCVPDIYAAGFNACYLELLELLQARAYIIVPIFSGSQLWGLLAVYQNSGPRQWEVSEIKIVTQTGNQLGVAVQQAELLAQTRQQAEELRQAKELADAANRAKSEFLANMSHELRTPLNAVLGFTQLMGRDHTLSPEHQQYTSIINRSGEHLLNLINDILEMSKIEAGRTSLNNSEFDLHALLDNLEEMLKLRATIKQLTLRFDRDPNVPKYIRTDESKLQQVLINLLGNAIKFTEQGSVRLRVTGVRCLVSGARVQVPGSEHEQATSDTYTLHFEVEDTGPGIAADEMNRLFEAFAQTRTGIRASEGTGLGLPISQTFVRLMGGEISVRSQVGQGSTFAFDIQATLAEASFTTISHAPRQTVIGLAPNQPTYRILVVEDIATNRLLLNQLLSPLGFEVREAENGEVALEIWEYWQPHLIFMDMQMPVMDGYEATRKIKATAAGQHTVIVALTASAFEEQRQVILSNGCDDFVRKPFQAAELLATIANNLGVIYLYDEVAQPHHVDGQTLDADRASLELLGGDTLTAQQLTVMPAAWIVDLQFAAAQCSDALTLQLIEQIPSDQSLLADRLRELVGNFRFDQVQALTQQAMA